MKKLPASFVILAICLLVAGSGFILLNMNKEYPTKFDGNVPAPGTLGFTAQVSDQGEEKTLRCVIQNSGTMKATWGEKYYLEKLVGDGWYEVANQFGNRADESSWNAILNTVDGGETRQFTISLQAHKLSAGYSYRVKVIWPTESAFTTGAEKASSPGGEFNIPVIIPYESFTQSCS